MLFMPRFERSKGSRGSRGGSSSRGRGSPKRGGNSRGPKNREESNRSFEEFSKGRGRDRGPKRSSSRNRRDFEMTSVICDSCGTKCEVPFKPTSDKPIYCKECFGGKDNERTSKGTITVKTIPNKDLDIINEKLNKIMKALEVE